MKQRESPTGHSIRCRTILLSAAFAVGAAIAGAAPAADPELPDLGSSAPDAQVRNKSYAIPAAEIVGFDYLLNRIDLWSRRDATFPSVSDLSQSRGTLGLYYVYLGRARFGAVDWR